MEVRIRARLMRVAREEAVMRDFWILERRKLEIRDGKLGVGRIKLSSCSWV